MDDRELCEARIGTTLHNKWTLERLLGIGGVAAVYVGLHKIGRRDAIKILHPDAASSSDMRARFEQEAHAVNQLGHPGVAEIRDIDVTEDGAPFLVMELLSGEPLSVRAQRLGAIEQDEILRLIDELCDVLAAAHSRGIVHRDIKLDNLFVLDDGRLKVLDFGIAHMRSDAVAMKTRLGVKLGTTPYMPPEQVRGLPIDGRADLFAVGATMFRLITKRRIHEAKTEPEMLLMMATMPAPELASVAPETPRDLCLIVDRALAFEREQRYPDASTMQRDVQAVRRGKPPPYATARLIATGPPSTPHPQIGLPEARGGAPEEPYSDMPTVVPSRPIENGPREDAEPPETSTPTPAAAPAPAPDPAPPLPPSPTAPDAPLVTTADMTPIPEGELPQGGKGTVRMLGRHPPGDPFPPDAGGGRSARSKRRRKYLLAGGLLVLLGAGVGLGWTLRSAALDVTPQSPSTTRTAAPSSTAPPASASPAGHPAATSSK